MGLDLYVGSLTRYFCGNWDTSLQQQCRKKGMPYSRENEGKETIKQKSRDQVHPGVIAWKKGVIAKLNGSGSQPFDWDESEKAPYFTDKLHFQGHSSLLLWAAYAEHPDLHRPEAIVEDFEEDEAYSLCTEEESKTEFPHLLKQTACWLPCEFDAPFETMDLCEAELGFGSANKLLDELTILNLKTWKADKPTIERWRRLGLGQSATLEEAARYALSVFLPLSEKAILNKLAMRLDW